ncbi:MAG: hypothetical protein WCX30_03295 [Candidatus Paceibacterota bacterium]|jgi:hypothetical protein|nr:hypothetical protein [bacterium]
MNIEEIFQKINKDNHELKNHRNNLRATLLENKYFIKKENNYPRLNITLPSLSLTLSTIIFIGVYILIPKTTPIQTLSKNDQGSSLYARLSKNNNTTKLTKTNETKTLEINQENTKTILHFNSNNVLTNSTVKK